MKKNLFLALLFVQILFSYVFAQIDVAQDPTSEIEYFKVQVTDPMNIPEPIRRFIPGKIFDRDLKDFNIYIALINELDLFNGFSPGDDYGYAHGMRIVGGKALKNGYYITVKYSSDLYTQPLEETKVEEADGSYTIQQKFKDENVLSFMVDTANKGELFYWRAEIGWQRLNSDPNNNNFMYASTQQRKLHKLLDQMSPGSTKVVNNISDGSGVEDGLIAGGFLGLQKSFYPSDTCRVRLSTELGHRDSTIEGARYDVLKGSSVLICQESPSKAAYRLELGAEVRHHIDGYEQSPYFDFSLGKNKWRLGIHGEYTFGDPLNYVKYNLPNVEDGGMDPMISMYFKYLLN